MSLLAGVDWVVIVVYFAVFYPAVMREEARFLRGTFPAEYDAWVSERTRAAPPADDQGQPAGADAVTSPVRFEPVTVIWVVPEAIP